MRCLSCKYGKVSEGFDTYLAKVNDGYLIIENVPCMQCDRCGETFFSYSVARKIEELVAAYEKATEKVSVIDYNQAA